MQRQQVLIFSIPRFGSHRRGKRTWHEPQRRVDGVGQKESARDFIGDACCAVSLKDVHMLVRSPTL